MFFILQIFCWDYHRRNFIQIIFFIIFAAWFWKSTILFINPQIEIMNFNNKKH